METLKNYFADFSADLKANAGTIFLICIILNMFVRFGIGLLLGVSLIGFVIHALYNRFGK